MELCKLADRSHCLQGAMLVGFSAQDAETVRAWFDGIEHGLNVACCREDHLSRSMDDIFSAPHGLLQHHHQWQEQIEPVPRAVILSGMSQREMLGIAEFWSLSGKTLYYHALAVCCRAPLKPHELLTDISIGYPRRIYSISWDYEYAAGFKAPTAILFYWVSFCSHNVA